MKTMNTSQNQELIRNGVVAQMLKLIELIDQLTTQVDDTIDEPADASRLVDLSATLVNLTAALNNLGDVDGYPFDPDDEDDEEEDEEED